jgi:transposase InsO family protein
MEENIPQKEFVSFCRDVGIKRELTTPYNPQQNGVAERKNRTIMEAVKTMIHDQDLPMCLWAEATMASCLCAEQTIP